MNKVIKNKEEKMSFIKNLDSIFEDILEYIENNGKKIIKVISKFVSKHKTLLLVVLGGYVVIKYLFKEEGEESSE